MAIYHRESGVDIEQPYWPLGIFKVRLPLVHYRWEWPECIQGILLCATCLGAIPVLTEVLGVPFEIAWGMVIINGFLYMLHAHLGDPVVPGWITPAIPLVVAWLNTYAMGPERTKALVALQLSIGIFFVFMGITGLAKRLIAMVPDSLKAGILIGAGFAAVMGEFRPGGRFGQFPFTLALSGLFAYYLLFSKSFTDVRKKHPFLNKAGRFGMLPALVLAIILGPLFGELSIPKVEIGNVFFLPPIREIINYVSPFTIGFPSLAIFLNALPLMFSAYIIAFGDFVTAEALITEADKARRDEKIDFNADRSNLISGVRNIIEALISPYTQLCGPLWAAVTASVAQRYQEGREGMDSIFSGAGTFRVTTFIAVATIPVVTLVRPILPVALSITLLVQGFVCARVGMNMIRTNEEMGVAGVMAAVLAIRGAAWGLAVGILLFLLVQYRRGKE
jgi:hypothetical protein